MKDIAAELAFLKKAPHFAERPATIAEFLGPEYLNVEDKIRPRIRQELTNIMGERVHPTRMTKYPLALFTGGIGCGKELRHNTPVLTPKGWIDISSIAVGDRVIGSNGKPTTVTGVYPQGIKPLYRVTFTDDSWVDAGADHQWAVRTRHQEYAGRDFRVRTTGDLASQNLRCADHGWKWRIPMVEPVEFEGEDHLPVDPYALGALMGDGCFTRRTITLAGDDFPIAERIKATLPPGIRMPRTPRDWCFSGKYGCANAFTAQIESLGYQVGGEGAPDGFDKRIPDLYMHASVGARLNLIRGMMDTDGHCTEQNCAIFSNGNLDLCLQLIELVQSLGGTAKITSFIRHSGGNIEYHVPINLGGVCPFWLPRKADKWLPRTNQLPKRAVKSINYVDDDYAFCISVDAPDSLYVTKDFIVTHNTSVASLVLTYMAHWVLCLKDPQDFFNLMPGSRIAFMQMSTSEKQALQVVFGDVKARVQHSEWFKSHPFDPNFKNQLRFDKDIWILPGDSAETTFEGYNILGGILDEADAHRVTPKGDYAEMGYTTIASRIDSRFGTARAKGFLMVVGQRKSAAGFAERKYQEFLKRDDAYAVSLTIWDSIGWPQYTNADGTRDSFWYDTLRKQIVPPALVSVVDNSKLIEIPNAYRKPFENDPVKALRDLAGMPPDVGDPFIALQHKITDARDRWLEHHPGFTSPVTAEGKLEDWFYAQESLPRVGHLDIAYAEGGDGLGFAMGHVSEVVEIEGEKKPYIVIDLMMRITAPAGSEIFLADVRHFIYDLRADRKFAIKKVTMDGFESTDTRQQFTRRRIESEIISIDRQVLPYHDLREALYEDRIEFPQYMTYMHRGDTELVEIAVKELSELVDNIKKIDHPPGVSGSKDLSDCLAGVCFSLMGDRSYRRKVTRISDWQTNRESKNASGGNTLTHPAYLGGQGVQMPLPPKMPQWGG